MHGNTDTSDMNLNPLQGVIFSNLQYKENKGKNHIKETVSIKDMKKVYKTLKIIYKDLTF